MRHFWGAVASGFSAMIALHICPTEVRAEPVVLETQSLASTNSLRTFDHNGARHIERDSRGDVFVVFPDGQDVWYQRGVARSDGGIDFQPAERVNDETTRIRVNHHVGFPATRGAALAILETSESTIIHIAWTVDSFSVYYRRVEEVHDGERILGEITDTGMSGHLPALAAQQDGRVHVFAEHSFVPAGQVSAIRHAWSDDGVSWESGDIERATVTDSYNYRFACVTVDQEDRVHMMFEAEGYQNSGGAPGAEWWAPRYFVLDGEEWQLQPSPLEDDAAWGPPDMGRQILFACCNLAADEDGSVHLAWHGTARSGVFALDDVFYSHRPYDSSTDSFEEWTSPRVLHRRIHDDAGGGPIEEGGEDDQLTWVPTITVDPESDAVYVVIMFGFFDDEIGPHDTSVGTESGLVFFDGESWQLDLLNLTNTPAGRNWFPNSPSRLRRNAGGARVLDVLWIDGVHDPDDPYAQNYDVIHATVALDPAAPDGDGDVDSDVDGDGDVDGDADADADADGDDPPDDGGDDSTGCECGATSIRSVSLSGLLFI